jgi:hypothetical protein
MRSWGVACPVCGQRKARRECPALRQTICSICCATKRLVEINCPPDCAHLAAAREHPAAVVRRQQEHDVAVLMPTIRGLTERQHQLFFLFHTAIARHSPEGFARLNDADVADAAAALASTFETAARGVIYEHAPESPVARDLATDLRNMLEEVRKQGAKVYDHETAVVLRAIEQGAREIPRAPGGAADAYLLLMGRLLQVNRLASSAQGGSPDDRPGSSRPGSSIVLP